MTDGPFTGGCQCGAVRFSAMRLGQSAICHCRMCQKAFGSYFGPLVMAEGVTWTRGEPAWFRSSNLARRGFCAACGTPLCYVEDDGGTELAGGTLDDPTVAPPTVQYNLRHKLPFFDALPMLLRQPHPELEAIGNARVVSFQHPDHETSIWQGAER